MSDVLFFKSDFTYDSHYNFQLFIIIEQSTAVRTRFLLLTATLENVFNVICLQADAGALYETGGLGFIRELAMKRAF